MIIRQYFSRARGIPLFSAERREIVLKAKKKRGKKIRKKNGESKNKEGEKSMIKLFKKLTAVTMAIAATITMAVSCGGGGGGGNSTQNPTSESTKQPTSEELATKTTLNVAVFNAGLGTVYFDEMAKDFEEYVKDKEYEPGTGKKGVRVVPYKEKEKLKPGTLDTSMLTSENVLYFLDQGNYAKYAGGNFLAEITETVNEKYLDEDGNIAKDTGKTGTQSIKDMMIDGYAECFDYNGTGKYYAIPFWISVPGIVYDAELFDKKGYYYLENGQIGGKQSDITAGKCSAGPDGEKGTSDDGLPATWNEFVSLMNYMVNDGVTPFTWDAAHEYQRSGVFTQIWANYEGYDDFMLNYTFKGTDSEFGEITEDNYQKLAGQQGRKAAIKAFYDIAKDTDFYSDKAVAGNDHLGAQEQYITSTPDGKPIAMFMEQSYWESEARSVFGNLYDEGFDNYAYGEHDYRFMPIPNFTGVEGIANQTNIGKDKRVIVGRGADNYICISARNKNANYDVQVEVAKDFIKFIQQREQLINFTKNTGCFRSFKYTPSATEAEGYTKYVQSISKYISEGARLTSNLPLAAKRRANEALFDESNNAFAFVVSTATGKLYDPFSYFKYESNKGKTVDNCFEEFKTSFNSQFKI